MAKDRFFIAPYNNDSGLQKDVKPWLIPDQAFASLTNAYVFRGRVRKRFGSRWLGNTQLETRFRINLGNTAAGAFVGNVRTITADAGMPTSIGQAFSVGDIFFTVFNPAAGAQTMYRSDGGAASTYNLTNSAVNIAGVGNGIAVYFYPGFPVMGLRTMEQDAVSQEKIIGFDTRFAYEYANGWERLATEGVAGAAVWTGNNAQFFWTTTWSSDAADRILFVTNFNSAEANFMRRLGGAPLTWDNFRPQLNTAGTLFMNSARILIPFKERLLAFNTYEGPAAGASTHYPQRVRYSKIGNPIDGVGNFGWRQNISGEGGGKDAPTTESIVSVEFIRDRLIVFFEQSTWELVYTNNQASPFAWQQINTELGAESTFSIIPMDKVAIGVGNIGIHACNGINVDRIDSKIPDEVFDIHNVDAGVDRVYGIRDYDVEMLYWAFPDVQSDSTFPFPYRVLVYNYYTGTWAINNDSITCFGYFQLTTGILWSSTTVSWDDSVAWGSGFIQAQARQVIAGNQEGFTFIIVTNEPTNASVLQITDIAVAANVVTFTVINHNLRVGDYIYFEGITGGNLNALNALILNVVNVTGANTFVCNYNGAVVLAGPYSGAGLISRVSNIDIRTKEYNFYANKGYDMSVSQVNFFVDRTNSGQITLNFYVDSAGGTNLFAAGGPAGTNSILGTNILETIPYPTEPFEALADRLWHPVRVNAEGNVVQFQLTMSDEQMRNVNVRESDFQLHALLILAQPSRSRLQ